MYMFKICSPFYELGSDISNEKMIKEISGEHQKDLYTVRENERLRTQKGGHVGQLRQWLRQKEPETEMER